MRPKALSGSIAKYSRGLVLSALALIGASEALGVTYYWDSNTTTAGAGATPTGTLIRRVGTHVAPRRR